MTARPPRGTVGGSTVYHGGYECECFDCWYERGPNRDGDGKPATWTCWRLKGKRQTPFGPRFYVSATWVMCDGCVEKSKRDHAEAFALVPSPDHETDLYLPLIVPTSPVEPYTTIAIQELCTGLAGLARTGPRVSERPLCGYHVHVATPREGNHPCREFATWVVRDWIDDSYPPDDLYLCERHVKPTERSARRADLPVPRMERLS